MASGLDFGSRGLGSNSGRSHCVVFLGKTLYSHCVSLIRETLRNRLKRYKFSN